MSIALLIKIMLLTFIEIKARGSQLQGEAKTKTASLVEALYSFDSGRSKHKIQKAVNKTWFNNKRDEGVVYQDYFNPGVNMVPDLDHLLPHSDTITVTQTRLRSHIKGRPFHDYQYFTCTRTTTISP